MATSITKDDLVGLHDAFRAELRQNTKDLIADQRESLVPIRTDLAAVRSDVTSLRDQMREVHTKLDAIMSGDVLVTRHQLLRLVGKLKAQGISLDETELFAA